MRVNGKRVTSSNLGNAEQAIVYVDNQNFQYFYKNERKFLSFIKIFFRIMTSSNNAFNVTGIIQETDVLLNKVLSFDLVCFSFQV